MKKITTILLLTLVFLPSLLLAGGKIAGKVTDVSSGDPLFNANILIVGTTRGAITDANGKFVIENVKEGKYTLRATIIGYEAMESKPFDVNDDATTTVNMKLTSSSVQLKGVEIYGEGAVTNVQATSSTKTVGARTIEQIPNVKSVQDIMAIQPGVVKMGNNVFLRGGRANQVQYLVDGVSVNNVLGSSSGTTSAANDELAQLNSGVGTSISASGLNISANAIQSLSVTTSGFDAEFGNAQSGVISIITKSGTDSYSGGFQMRTDRMNDATSVNEKYYSFSFGGPEPITSQLLSLADTKLPGNLTFFVSADFSQNDGPNRYDNNSFFNPLSRSIAMRGPLGDIFGIKYTDALSNAYTFDGKLKYDFEGSNQMSYSYRASFGTNHDYQHTWKYRADSTTQRENASSQNSLQWTHFLGQNAFYRFQVSVLDIHGITSVGGLTPPEYSGYVTSTEGDPSRDGFQDISTQQIWYNDFSRTSTIKFDLNEPVHELHYLKAGFETNFEEFKTTDIEDPVEQLSGTISPPYPDSNRHDEGLYPGYGLFRWNLLNYPNTGSAYVQDIMKFFGTNLHIGFRYDYLWMGNQVLDPRFVREWEQNVNPFNGTRIDTSWVKNKTGGSSFLYYLTHGYISPRLAINFPITERIGFFFNYGHFIQFPDRNNYLRTPYIISTSSKAVLVGNPNLKPERTIQYESGFEDQITDDMGISVRGFYKDIFDLLSQVNAHHVTIGINSDYASSRGFEITLTKATSYHFSGNISYSYQIAKGRQSNPTPSSDNPNFSLPREIRLDWDQRNTLNVLVGYRVEPNENYTLFGMPFMDDWGLSLTGAYGSGFPYTPTTDNLNAIEAAYKQNFADGPSSLTLNLSFSKGFAITNKLKLGLSLDVVNLLDRRNINVGSGGFNNNDGRPYQFGDYGFTTKQISQWYKMPGLLPPSIYSAPRQILLGLKLGWG